MAQNIRSGMRGLAGVLVVSGALSLPQAAWADDPAESPFRFGGYGRGWLSWNMQDQPERPDSGGRLSMARASVMLDADWKVTPSAKLKAIVRVDREYKTRAC